MKPTTWCVMWHQSSPPGGAVYPAGPGYHPKTGERCAVCVVIAMNSTSALKKARRLRGEFYTKKRLDASSPLIEAIEQLNISNKRGD